MEAVNGTRATQTKDAPRPPDQRDDLNCLRQEGSVYATGQHLTNFAIYSAPLEDDPRYVSTNRHI